jgi:hypothetical protein
MNPMADTSDHELNKVTELTSIALVDKEVHREMMKTVLKEFTKQGFTNMRANVENMTAPEKIGDYAPDLTCRREDMQQGFVILEVETCNTMTQEQSEEKWRAFCEKAKKMIGEFHLAVPKFCNGNSGRTLASQRLERVRIKVDRLWVVNGGLQAIAMRAKAGVSSR